MQKALFYDKIILVNKIYEKNEVMSMGNNKVKFRNAVGGYNKLDVNSYIEMLSERYYEKDVEYQKTISDLKKRIAELERAEEEKNAEIIKAGELVRKLEESERLILSLNGAIEDMGAKNEELIKENAELQIRLTEAETVDSVSDEVIEKSSKYDQVSEQIGSMLISAEARAESIVAEAELKAKVSANKMIDDTFERLKSAKDRHLNDIVTKSVLMTETLRALSLEAKSFCDDEDRAIERDKNEIKEYLEYTKKIIEEN